FFNDTATTEIYTLSLHDALPIYQGAMILAQVGEVAGFHRDPAQVGGQEVQGGIDMVGERDEFRASGDGLATQQAGFQRHRGVDETVRVGQDGFERGEPAGGHAGLDPQTRDGGLKRGARQAAGLANPIQSRREDRVVLQAGVQVGVAHGLEIGAVRVQQARQRFGHLGAFPGGPDAVRGQRDRSAYHREQRSRRHQIGGRHADAGEQQHHQRGQRGHHYAVIRRTGPAHQEHEDGDEERQQGGGGRDGVEQRGGERESGERADQAQDATAEGGGEIGLEHDGYGH